MDGEYPTVQDGSVDSAGDIADSRRSRRRLLIEAAIEERYPLRLEKRTATGRTSSRIVQPIGLELPKGGAIAGAILVTRNLDRAEFGFALDEIADVSLVTTRLRDEDERRGRWSIGDPVRVPRFGPGIVQAFRDVEGDELIVVRFDEDGPQALPLNEAELHPLDS